MRKKIIYLVLAMMSLANVSKAENIGVDNFTIAGGDTLQVALKLTNTHTDLTAFSMTMQLPAGLKLLEAIPTDRFQGEVMIGNPDTRAYNICGLDLGFGTITGKDGDLLMLKFTADKTFKTSDVTISDIDFITTGRDYVKVDKATFTVTSGNSSTGMLGDVDGSGEVNITDVMVIIDYMLDRVHTTFIFSNADVNKDGEVNLSDALFIVNYFILHKN